MEDLKTKTMGEEIIIRDATVNDIEAMLNVYAPYVENTAVSFEYEVPSIDEFRSRLEKITKKYPYFLAEDSNGKVLGYTYYSEFKDREAYRYSVETTIYLAKEACGRGIGRNLYEVLEKAAKAQNITNMNACIATCKTEDEYLTNRSYYFHEKMGYKLVGTFHNSGYKFDRWYDMVWMEKIIADSFGKAKPFIPYKEVKDER